MLPASCPTGRTRAPGDPFAAAFLRRPDGDAHHRPAPGRQPHPVRQRRVLGLTGYRRDEVVGRNCRFLQGPDTDPGTLALRSAPGSRPARPSRRRSSTIKKDGSPFWNSLVISPIRDEAGDLLYFFSSQFDVSAKKKAEMELTRAKAAPRGGGLPPHPRPPGRPRPEDRAPARGRPPGEEQPPGDLVPGPAQGPADRGHGRRGRSCTTWPSGSAPSRPCTGCSIRSATSAASTWRSS